MEDKAMKKRYTGVLAALAAGVLIFSTGLTGEAARIGTITTDGSRGAGHGGRRGTEGLLPADRYHGRHYR